MSQASFQKQQREKARRERTAAKVAKRAERGAAAEAEAEADAEPLAPPSDQGAILAALADLHGRFETGDITFDEFEVSKQRLVEQLDVG